MTLTRMTTQEANTALREISELPSDDVALDLRSILIDPDDGFYDDLTAYGTEMRDAVRVLQDNAYAGDPDAREALTSWRLDHSLCPIHGGDYAICFGDDDPDCAQVRMIHPGHDT